MVDNNHNTSQELIRYCLRQSKMHMHAWQQQSSYPNLQPANTGSKPCLVA